MQQPFQMLFRQHFLNGIGNGTITLAFRRWRRPSVKAGGTLLTAVGQLHIESVREIDAAQISKADARRAGFESHGALLAELNRSKAGTLYRIEFGRLEADPRVALRRKVAANADERAAMLERLRRLDARSAGGPWTLHTLDLIRKQPGVRAGDLCVLLDQEMMHFKGNVRKLKGMGLTESLEIGYRLSPRGNALLRDLERDDNDV
jgi:hypothetical protein